MKPRAKGKRISVVGGVILLAVLAITIWLYWAHIRFWWRFEPLGRNEKGYPEYRHRQTGIVMVRVPGGTFMMGSPEGETGRDTKQVQHEVTLSPFLIAKYEVSQSTWKDVMGDYQAIFEGDDFPAKRLSWEDCQQFCGRTGLRFPSEAQWENACRAGTTGPYAGTGRLDEMGWYKENSKVIGGGDKRNPVGKKKPNGFGHL